MVGKSILSHFPQIMQTLGKGIQQPLATFGFGANRHGIHLAMINSLLKDNIGLKVQNISLVVGIKKVEKADFDTKVGNCADRPLGCRKLKVLEVSFDVNPSRETINRLAFGRVKRNGGVDSRATTFLRKNIDTLMHRIHCDGYNDTGHILIRRLLRSS
jgi:hypothetical protein